jgi:hypothetical protein
MPDGLPAQVHVSNGLYQYEDFSFQFEFCPVGVSINGERRTMFFGQKVNHVETYVVPGLFVFGSDISQTRDKELHKAKVRNSGSWGVLSFTLIYFDFN